MWREGEIMFQFKVKGQRFCISAEELARHPTTLFSELNHQKQDDIPSFSRDPQFVGILLVYLRKGTIRMRFEELTFEQQTQFVNDVAFYRIPGEVAEWAVTAVVPPPPLVPDESSTTGMMDVADIGLVACYHCGSVGAHNSDTCPHMPPHILPFLPKK